MTTGADATMVLREAAADYMAAVKRLGEQSGYNKLTFFEAPISKMPNDELGMEAVRRWQDLNDTGKALAAALAASLASPPPVAEGEAQPVAIPSMTPTPETSLPATEASMPVGAEWCQPGDQQDKQHYLVRFDDPDCNDAVFTDWTKAREFYAKATLSWNCWLFAAVPVAALTPLPSPVGGEAITDPQGERP